MLKSGHAGDAGAAVTDVVDYFVGSAEDFAGLPWGSAYQVLGWIILNIG